MKINLVFLKMKEIPNLKRIGICFIASIIAGALVPVILGSFVDSVVRHETFKKVTFIFVCMVLMNFLGIVLKSAFQRMINRSARYYTLNLQNQLLENLSQMSPGALNRYKHGELGAKFFRDCQIVTHSINGLFPALVGGAVASAVSLAIMLGKNKVIALGVVAFLPVCFYLLWLFQKKLKTGNKDYRSHNDQMMNRIFNFLESFSDLKSMAVFSRFHPKIKAIFKKNAVAGHSLDHAVTNFEFTIMSLLFIGEGMVMACAGYLAWSGMISIGDVVVYQMLFLQTMGAIASIFQVLPHVEMIGEAWNSIEELHKHPTIENDTGKTILSSFKGGIILKNVSFSYNQQTEIVKGLNFEIPPKACVIITGCNGSGKSTLLKLITTQLQPGSGEILFDGISHHAIDRNALRREMAIVSQEPILLSCSLRDNISLRNPAVDDRRIQNLLHQVGLDYLLEKLPHGLDSDMGLDGHILSGGERQRLAVARVLAQRPKVIVFDELTNNLDDASQEQIIQIITRLKNTCTLLIVSHDVRITSLSEITLSLNQPIGVSDEHKHRLAACI